MTTIVLDDDERAGLAAYLGRLVALDNRGAVRLQAAGMVLGAWAGPPLDVVTLRPVALGAPVEVDVTVSASRLLDRLTASRAGEPSTELPPSVSGPAWAGLLPPKTGWTARATVPTGSVVEAVQVAVEGFGRRVELVPEPDRSRGVLDAIAADLWNRPVVAGIPLRAAHAAHLTGLLGRDGEVTALDTPTWQRLACPGGSVAVRKDAGGGLSLSVWSLSG